MEFNMNEFPVILFDGICNFCCGWVQFLIRHDKEMKFRFASIQSEIGQGLLKKVGLNNNSLKTIVYIQRNEIFTESSAVLEILRELGGSRVMVGVLKLIPKPLRDRFYQFISKKRYAIFGKRTSCYLPTPENKKRFLT
ncbi:MAG: thiol-disulfide oxidoreductase DCC family protein [Paludibacter sp.]|nr:thiol-disulfide oxidoreductase DCC family protein [Paludibacter sp.]